MLRNDNETRLDLTNRPFDGSEALNRERRLNVSRAKVYAADRKLTRIHREQTEVAIMCDDDAAFGYGPGKHGRIRLAAKTQLDRGDDVFALPAKLRSHLRMNVLVGQQMIGERLHAGIFTLLDGLGQLADPGRDETGLALASAALPQRARLRRPRGTGDAQ
jgi:hypothetical protein